MNVVITCVLMNPSSTIALFATDSRNIPMHVVMICVLMNISSNVFNFDILLSIYAQNCKIMFLKTLKRLVSYCHFAFCCLQNSALLYVIRAPL